MKKKLLLKIHGKVNLYYLLGMYVLYSFYDMDELKPVREKKGQKIIFSHSFKNNNK